MDYINRNKIFPKSSKVFYDKKDIDRLREMCNTLYHDKTPWVIIERPNGLYVTNSDIDMYYLEFIMSWIIPSLFMSSVTQDKSSDKLIMYSYDLNNEDIFDHSDVYDLLFSSDSIINECYNRFHEIMEIIDNISTDKQ